MLLTCLWMKIMAKTHRTFESNNHVKTLKKQEEGEEKKEVRNTVVKFNRQIMNVKFIVV